MSAKKNTNKSDDSELKKLYWDNASLGVKAFLYLIKKYPNRYKPKVISALFAALFKCKGLPEVQAIREELIPLFDISLFYINDDPKVGVNWSLFSTKTKRFLSLWHPSMHLITTAKVVSESEFSEALPEKFRNELDCSLNRGVRDFYSDPMSAFFIMIDLNASFELEEWEDKYYKVNHDDLDKCYEAISSMKSNGYKNKKDFYSLHKALLNIFKEAYCVPCVKFDEE